MNYLQLGYESNPKIIGVKDGNGQAYFSEEFFLKNPILKDFMWGLNNNNFLMGIPPVNFELNLFELNLEKNSKLTDFIEVSGIQGFVVSNKLRCILENSHLPKHKYYTVSFRQLDKKTGQFKIINGYWWLFFQKDTGENDVEFEKCELDFTYHIKHLNILESDIKITTYDQYIDFTMKTQTAPKAKSITFNKNFDKKLDIWGFRFLSTKNYISDRLIKILEQNNITGYSANDLKNGIFPCELKFE